CDAAVYLSVSDHRINDAAGVLRHQKFFNPDMAGLHINVDDGGVASVGKRSGRIVVACFRQARLYFALEAVRLRISLASKIRYWDRPVRARDYFHSIGEHDVARRNLQQMAGDLEQFGPNFPRSDQYGSTRDDQRAAAEGSPAIWCAVGIAMHHLDLLGRDAELVREDLGERRAQALSMRRAADPGLDKSCGADSNGYHLPPWRELHPAGWEGVAAIAGAFGEGREADAEMTAVGASFFLAFAEAGHVDGLDRHLERLFVGRLVIFKAHNGFIGKSVNQ